MKTSLRIAIPGFSPFLNYRNAVEKTGASLGIPTSAVLIGEDLDGSGAVFQTFEAFHVDAFDGLLLPGGEDVDPARYGEEDCGSEGISEALDRLQFDTLEAFVRAGKPVLGICRGHQVVNVYFGGSLIQDIPEKADHGRINDIDSVHPVRTEDGSLLAALYGEKLVSNSSHHQATGRVGDGLRITAHAADGVVEAAEHEKLPIWTTQFHPERMMLDHSRPDAADGTPIFEYFLKACARE